MRGHRGNSKSWDVPCKDCPKGMNVRKVIIPVNHCFHRVVVSPGRSEKISWIEKMQYRMKQEIASADAHRLATTKYVVY